MGAPWFCVLAGEGGMKGQSGKDQLRKAGKLIISTNLGSV